MDAPTSLLSGHMAIAGAINGAAAFGESFAGPLFAPLVELGSAAITATVAVHAVHRVAGKTRQPTFRILHRVARTAGRTHKSVLAAQALDLVCRVGARDRRALHVGAALLGRYAIAQVRGVFGHMLTAWCPPLHGAGSVLVASRAALLGAHFLKTVEAAALAEVSAARRATRIPPAAPANSNMEVAA
jgi:hypothetical protein